MKKARDKKQQAKSGGKRRASFLDSRLRALELLCAIALSVAVIVLHVHRANQAGPLWRDEVGTLSLATFPSFAGTWSLLYSESFPILIYLVVHVWTALGWHEADISLRVLGAIIGIGGIGALWSAKHLIDRRVPILSLALFGMNATVLLWGDSLRAYGLGVLLILLVYGAIWRVAISPTRPRIVFAAAVTLLSVQCLYQNAFLVLAICIGGCVVCLRRRMWKGIVSILGIGFTAALSQLIYLPTIIRTQATIAPVVRFPFEFSHLLQIFANALASSTGSLLWIWLIGAGTCLVAGAVLVTSRREKEEREPCHTDVAAFTLTTLLLGTTLFMLFLKGMQMTTETWYYIVLMGPIALSIDVAIELLSTVPATRLLRIAVALGIAAVSFPAAWNQAATRQTNLDVIAAELGRQAAKDDFLVVIPWFNGITFQNYYHGQTKWSTAPPISDLKLTRYDLLKEQLALEHPLQPVFDSMEKSLKAGAKVWIVGEVVAPADGEQATSLPPAPNGPHGWYSGDYLRAWNLQLGQFLKDHAASVQRTGVLLNQPISPYEDSPVLVVGGWRQ